MHARGSSPGQSVSHSDGEGLHAAPLTRLAAGALAGVLAAQRDEWLERLDWDLGDVSVLIRESIDARTLSGSVLLSGGDVAGYGFFTPEPGRCLIGDVYVALPHRTPEASALLARHMLEQIGRLCGRRRVESQSVQFDTRGLDEAFAERGFSRHERCYLAAELGDGGPGPVVSGRARLRPWIDSDFGPVAELIYQGYLGTVDARTNVGYRSRDGCADLLDALTDSPWCGRFDPDMTQVAVDTATGRCCGVAIASRISQTTAHLGQISVLPAYQGQGIGRALVVGALAAAARTGFERVTLAVTAANETASRLYARCGFRSRLDFPIYVRDTR